MNVGMRLPIETQCLLHHAVEVVRHESSRWQARETGEFVDQILYLIHLAYDGGRTLVEHIALCCRELVEVAFLQSLGRELDGREGILDFMCQAACHLSPCFHALHTQEMRYILQEQHDATLHPIVVGQ